MLVSVEKYNARHCESPHIHTRSQMDATLKTLVNVEHLSLGTNMIEKIENVGSLKTIKILSLGRNQIKALTGKASWESAVKLAKPIFSVHSATT